MPQPFRSQISIVVRQLGPIYFPVWTEQVALYLALPKFMALVDRNSLQVCGMCASFATFMMLMPDRPMPKYVESVSEPSGPYSESEPSVMRLHSDPTVIRQRVSAGQRSGVKAIRG
jgi:hypothetical protein